MNIVQSRQINKTGFLYILGVQPRGTKHLLNTASQHSLLFNIIYLLKSCNKLAQRHILSLVFCSNLCVWMKNMKCELEQLLNTIGYWGIHDSISYKVQCVAICSIMLVQYTAHQSCIVHVQQLYKTRFCNYIQLSPYMALTKW